MKINTSSKTSLFKRFNCPFSAFRAEPFEDADIFLNIGPFDPDFDNRDIFSIDYNFFVGNDYLYLKDFEGRMGKFYWTAEIIGITKDKTIINFNSKLPFLHRLSFPDLLPQLLLVRPILYYKLSQKNAILLHAGGVWRDNKAYIFAGRSGSFKSSLLMDLVQNHGWESNSDEHVIVKNNEVLDFPLMYPLFNYMCNKLRLEDFSILDKIKFLQSLLRENDRMDTAFRHLNGQIKAIFLLHRTNKDVLKISEIKDPFLAVKKLLINNMSEWYNPEPLAGIKSGRIYEYISMYSFINHDNNVNYFWDYHKKLLFNLVSKTKVYSIEIPNKYNNNVAEKINVILSAD